LQCLVDNVTAADTSTNTNTGSNANGNASASATGDVVVNFNHSYGCDQGGPFTGSFLGWYAENILEECDHPGEFFFSTEEKALYYTFNSTEQPTGEEEFMLTTAKIIFNVSGAQANPVVNLTIRGLTIRDAAYTYLGTTEADIHYLPAASDWVIQRSGAVTLEGTEGFRFDSNHLTRCDGNGLKLSNYNRNTTIIGNELSWIGDNAISAFGSMSRCIYANCSVRLNYPSGVDGRAGDQPRDTQIVGNLIREVGMWQKQSGAYVGHLAARTHFESNVIFNGPHAALNFNDGFGGGDELVANLLFNWDRQTIYHGVINVWERMPYVVALFVGR
jgi:hypothetical protein